MADSASEQINASRIATQSVPIEIPVAKRDGTSFDREHQHDGSHSKSGRGHAQSDVAKSHASDDEHRMPEGSPFFSVIMNELGSNLSKTTIRPEIQFPVSPLTASDDHLPEVFSSDEAPSPEPKTPPEIESPSMVKKKLDSHHEPHRNRSQSWNYRNKMAAERRKQLNLTVPNQLETKSAHSTPLNVRKLKQTKSQPGTPQLLHVHPKFKILTQNLSLSHDDIVKEEERERHLAEGFSEVKSIFNAPNFDRSGATPEKE